MFLFAEPGPAGLVFPSPRGGYLRRSSFRRRFWLPALKRAGLTGLRFHDLRHTAATFARLDQLAEGTSGRAKGTRRTRSDDPEVDEETGEAA